MHRCRFVSTFLLWCRISNIWDYKKSTRSVRMILVSVDRTKYVCSEFYWVCCNTSSTIHSENVLPNSGFLDEEIGMYAEEGVINFDKEIPTWEIIFSMISSDRCWRVWTCSSFFWRLGHHGGLG